MSLLVETIKVVGGKLMNITYHNERMELTLYDLFGKKGSVNLEKIIEVPHSALDGIYKCRVVYDIKITEIEFIPYILKDLRSLRLVYDDNISYSHKYTDRININSLMDQRKGCDDILIIKNGKVTDTSYANVILKDQNGNWITPSSYLLNGTRRSNLLNNRCITEADIHADDLKKYSEIRVINAMIGIDDSMSIPVNKILYI